MRQLAFQVAPERSYLAAKILTASYQPGDHRFLADLLERPADEDNDHWLGFDVLDLIKAHPEPDADRALLLLYERGPCAFCRCEVVKLLLQLGRVPEWVRQECRFDADPETRALVSP